VFSAAVVGVEFGFELGAVGLALHHEIERSILEAVDSALGEQHVVEHGDPLGRYHGYW
jgi:hypothetical protein